MEVQSKVLTGKVAVVTGAPRSIGHGIASQLGELGADVVVHYHSRKEEAERTVQSLTSRGVRAVAVAGDLTDSTKVRSVFNQAVAAFGGIDIVVANAGATTALTPVADITDDQFDLMLSVNTRAVFYVLREATRRVRDGGRIINITSSSAKFTPAGFAAYAASKAGANVVVKVLATELGARGITANSVMSGPVEAGFLDPSSEVVAAAPVGMLDSIAAAAPAGRLGRPEDIASVVAFLATPAAGWVNGQIILVNNGAAI
jgi:3-oxoacyl-[acyl-carrier protein] reductase